MGQTGVPAPPATGVPAPPGAQSAADVLRQGEELLAKVKAGAPPVPNVALLPGQAAPGQDPADVLRRGEELLRQSQAITAKAPTQAAPQPVGLPGIPGVPSVPGVAAPMLNPAEVLRKGQELMASVTAHTSQTAPGGAPGLAQLGQVPSAPPLMSPAVPQLQQPAAAGSLPPWKQTA